MIFWVKMTDAEKVNSLKYFFFWRVLFLSPKTSQVLLFSHRWHLKSSLFWLFWRFHRHNKTVCLRWDLTQTHSNIPRRAHRLFFHAFRHFPFQVSYLKFVDMWLSMCVTFCGLAMLQVPVNTFLIEYFQTRADKASEPTDKRQQNATLMTDGTQDNQVQGWSVEKRLNTIWRVLFPVAYFVSDAMLILWLQF